MAGNTVGEAIYKISVDTTELKSGLSKARSEVETSTSNFSKLGSAAKTAGKAIGASIAAGTVAATAAVAKLAKASLKAFADYEQLTGGVETLFKNSANEIMMYSLTAYKEAGLSANEYLEQATSFSARLIQGLGGDTKKAAEYANKAIVDMSDNANKMGTSIEMIQNAYQGFAKQNYTMLDNLKLGYGGTAGEMARLINDSGVLGKTMKVTAKTVNDVSFDKMIEAIHKVQGNLGITGTTAKEAASTISGSINSMKAAWKNLLVAIASEEYDWGEAVDGFVSSLVNVFKNIGPRIKIIAEGIAILIQELAPILTEMIPVFVNDILPPVVNAIVQLAIALIPYIPKIITILVDALVQNLPAIVEGIKQLIPLLIGLIPVLIGAVWQILGAILGEIGKWVGQVGEFLGQMFSGIWEGVINGAKAAWDGITGIFKNLANFFGSIFSKAWEAVKKVFSTGGKIFDGIKDGIVKAFKAVVNAIIRGINTIVAIPFNAINGVLSGLRGINILGIRPFGWLPSIGVPQIPYLATGGIVPDTNGGRLIVAGDGGEDEWVVPESKMASLIDQLNARGAGNITINVSGTFATSTSEQRKVAEVIAERLQEVQKSRLNAGGIL